MFFVFTGCYDPYANPAAELRNLIAIICRRLASYRPIAWFMDAALWMLVILTFIEPPIWCQSWDETTDDDSCANLLSLQGVAAGEEETSDPVQVRSGISCTKNKDFLVSIVCVTVLSQQQVHAAHDLSIPCRRMGVSCSYWDFLSHSFWSVRPAHILVALLIHAAI